MKKCYICNEFKGAIYFNKNKSKKDGLSTECKDCKKQTNLNYVKENAEKCKKIKKEYYENNKDILYEKKKQYINDNKLAHLKRQHIWYEKNKENIKKRTSKYKSDNPKKYQMYNNRRAAKKITLIIEKFTIKDIVNKYGDKCFYCSGSFLHIDHYIPLSKGGSHSIDNVRPSCETCNLMKSNKLPEEFIEYKRKLNEF